MRKIKPEKFFKRLKKFEINNSYLTTLFYYQINLREYINCNIL